VVIDTRNIVDRERGNGLAVGLPR